MGRILVHLEPKDFFQIISRFPVQPYLHSAVHDDLSLTRILFNTLLEISKSRRFQFCRKKIFLDVKFIFLLEIRGSQKRFIFGPFQNIKLDLSEQSILLVRSSFSRAVHTTPSESRVVFLRCIHLVQTLSFLFDFSRLYPSRVMSTVPLWWTSWLSSHPVIRSHTKRCNSFFIPESSCTRLTEW